MTDTVFRLSADPEAPSIARRYVAGMSIPRTPEVRDHVLLIVSELVTNAVQHAGASQLTVHASIAAARVRIAVHDYGEAMPDSLPQVPEPTALSGRGLVIVSALASRWGVVADVPPPGKTVWAELDTRELA